MLALRLAQFPVLAFAYHQAERRIADRAAHEHAVARACASAAHHRSFRHAAEHRNGNRDRPRRPVGVPAEQGACQQDRVASQPFREPFEPIIANVLGQRERQKKAQRSRTFRSQIRQIHAQSLAGDRTRGILGKKVHASDNGVGLQHKVAARWRVRNAASSDRPSAPGWVAMGSKNRAIRRSSVDLSSRPGIVSPGDAVEFARAQASRELIEHGVDHAGLVAADESGGDIRVFGDDHARRHIVAMDQLIGARPQGRAHHRFDALQRPALRQRFIDQGIKLALFADHSGNDVTEKSCFGGQILRSFDLTADPVTFKLGENVVKAGPG